MKEEKKKVDGCLNEEHIKYATRDIHTLYKGVGKVLPRLRIMPTRRRYSVLVNALRISAETPVLALVHIHIIFFIILQTGKDCQTLSCLMTTYMYTTSTSSINQNQTAPIGIIC